jgi:hypothetical protein
MLVENSEVDLNIRDNWGRSPLWEAASSGYKTIVELLLDSDKVDPEARDEQGRTPLLAAIPKNSIVMHAMQSRKGVVEAFLASGRVVPDAKDAQGRRLWFGLHEKDMGTALRLPKFYLERVRLTRTQTTISASHQLCGLKYALTMRSGHCY